MAWLQKRKDTWYVCYWEGKKKIKKSLKTGDEAIAQESLKEYQNSENKHSKEDAIIKLFRIKDKDIKVNRCLIKDILTASDAQPQPRTLSKYTITSKRSVIKKFIKWVENNHSYLKYVDELTEKHAAEYIASLKDKAGRTKLNHLSSMSSVFSLLLIPYNIERNIWKSVVRNEAISVRKQDLSIEQIYEIFKQAKKYKNSKVKNFWPAAIALGFYTGLRLHDVCTLSWDEIDMENNTITLIPSKTRKKGSELTFNIRPEFGKYLKELYDGQTEGYVWPDVASAKFKSLRWISDEFTEICEAADIQTTRPPLPGEGKKTVVLVGFHSLRHSFVTVALDMGMDKANVTRAVGHGSPVMTERYDHSKGAGRQISSSLPTLGSSKLKVQS